MDFNYSSKTKNRKEARLQRFLEILPGALSWLIIIGIICLSIWQPIITALFMIAFLLYWLLRLIYMNIFLVLSYMRLSIEKNVDWMKRIEAIDNLKSKKPVLSNLNKLKGLKNRISQRIHYDELINLKKKQ